VLALGAALTVETHGALVRFLGSCLLEAAAVDRECQLHPFIVSLMEALHNCGAGPALSSALMSFTSALIQRGFHELHSVALLRLTIDTPTAFLPALQLHSQAALEQLGAVLAPMGELFFAPAQQNLTEAIQSCERVAKVLYPLLIKLCPYFVAHRASCASALLRLQSRLIVLVSTDKVPVNCVAPLSIAFASIAEVFCESPSDTAALFFREETSAAVSAGAHSATTVSTQMQPLMELAHNGKPIAQVLQESPSVCQVSLARGVLIVSAGLTRPWPLSSRYFSSCYYSHCLSLRLFPKLLFACRHPAKGTLLLHLVFPRLLRACESTVSCDQWIRASVFQATQTFSQKLRECISGATAGLSLQETVGMSPQDLFREVLRPSLDMVFRFWEDSNDGVVSQARLVFQVRSAL
jgi:hypothetical protein